MNKPNFKTILLIISAISFSCNTAAPPRPIDGQTSAKQTAGEARPVPTPNEQAIAEAHNVEIEKLDGKTFRLADFRGKVLVVDFWATYCPPCVKQVPQLAKLNERYRDKGLVVVGLTSDDKTDEKQVSEFLKKAGADYTIGYDNQWLSEAFLKGTEDETGAPPIPQLFVISREGRVIEHLIGDSPQRGIQYLERVIANNLDSTSK
jgi:thiol-disulfide isomerase/thioredoxin